jgi:hypothetical protein
MGALFTPPLAAGADTSGSGWVCVRRRDRRSWKETAMTFMGLEVDVIWVVMIACIAVVSVSLFGLCRACILEHRYYRTRGRVRPS